MLALAHHYNEPVAGPDGTVYRARVYGGAEDGRWGGWIVFFPLGGGRVISTDRETTQASIADLTYWASGLTHTYLHGALERAITLQPEEQLARELERLSRVEVRAELEADALEAAASVARSHTTLAKDLRERTEEELLAAVADAAETDATVHEAAARQSRREAQLADRALAARKTKSSATKTSKGKPSKTKSSKAKSSKKK